MTLSPTTRQEVPPLPTLSGAVSEAQWDRVGHISLFDRCRRLVGREKKEKTAMSQFWDTHPSPAAALAGRASAASAAYVASASALAAASPTSPDAATDASRPAARHGRGRRSPRGGRVPRRARRRVATAAAITGGGASPGRHRRGRCRQGRRPPLHRPHTHGRVVRPVPNGRWTAAAVPARRSSPVGGVTSVLHDLDAARWVVPKVPWREPLTTGSAGVGGGGTPPPVVPRPLWSTAAGGAAPVGSAADAGDGAGRWPLPPRPAGGGHGACPASGGEWQAAAEGAAAATRPWRRGSNASEKTIGVQGARARRGRRTHCVD